uniref:C2H2-type domain-containing protein n=1 Tax=Hippocampus comes TaxID=109280 RepID=A0A3Q2YUS8_HIPCM
FASTAGRSEHQRTHSGDAYTCAVCRKVFTTPSAFRDHATLHTGRKPHPCSVCSKSFNRPGLLRKHLQKHLEDATNRRLPPNPQHRCQTRALGAKSGPFG